MAHAEAVSSKRRNFVLLVLKDALETNALPDAMRKYVRARACVDATQNCAHVLSRIR